MLKVGDQVSEKGRVGIIQAIHTKGTADVLFSDMEYAIRRQGHNLKRVNPMRKKSVPKPMKDTERWEAEDLSVYPSGKFPIGDLYHARLALQFAMFPSNKKHRAKVLQAVEYYYPEYNWAAWWNSRRNQKGKGTSTILPFKDYLEEDRYAMAANPRNPFTRRKNGGDFTNPSKRQLRAKYRKKHGANWYEKKSIHTRYLAEWNKIRSK
jgi:hypothetical protein